MKVIQPVVAYLKEYKIDTNRIANRYVQILKMLHEFIRVYALSNDVKINGRMLKKAVVDYFCDIVRIKEFHNISNINKEKIYGYMAYWLLRRKPIQIINNFNGCEFINELFITFYLTSLVTKARKIDNNIKNNHPTFGEFQSLLNYNLKYRPVSQQSLELMIEAFFCGFDLHKSFTRQN